MLLAALAFDTQTCPSQTHATPLPKPQVQEVRRGCPLPVETPASCSYAHAKGQWVAENMSGKLLGLL